MTLSAARIAELAAELEAAALGRSHGRKAHRYGAQLTLADAYEVQWSLAQPPARRRGSRLSGLENGAHLAREDAANGPSHSPIYGFLLDEYYAAPDSDVPAARLIHRALNRRSRYLRRRDLLLVRMHHAHALACIDFRVACAGIH